MVRYALRRAPFFVVRERVSYGLADPVEPAVGAESATLPEQPAPPLSDAPVPDPFDDADALDDLGYRIATLSAHIHAATQRLLLLIADFDRRRGWELDGQRSCAHWLAYRTGIDLGAAREKVRTARALSDLPVTSASMARGELSFSAVRALTRVADAENEADLLDLARGCTTQQLERIVRAFRRGNRKDEAALERERHESRTFSVFPDDDGMYAVRGRLDPEVGALLMRALEAAGDALFQARPVPAPLQSYSVKGGRNLGAGYRPALGTHFLRKLPGAVGCRSPADAGSLMSKPVTEFTTTIPVWIPRVTPVNLATSA